MCFLGGRGSKSCKLPRKRRKRDMYQECSAGRNLQQLTDTMGCSRAADALRGGENARAGLGTNAPVILRKHVDMSDAHSAARFNGMKFRINRLVSCADGEHKQNVTKGSMSARMKEAIKRARRR